MRDVADMNAEQQQFAGELKRYAGLFPTLYNLALCRSRRASNASTGARYAPIGSPTRWKSEPPVIIRWCLIATARTFSLTVAGLRGWLYSTPSKPAATNRSNIGR